MARVSKEWLAVPGIKTVQGLSCRAFRPRYGSQAAGHHGGVDVGITVIIRPGNTGYSVAQGIQQHDAARKTETTVEYFPEFVAAHPFASQHTGKICYQQLHYVGVREFFLKRVELPHRLSANFSRHAGSS